MSCEDGWVDACGRASAFGSVRRKLGRSEHDGVASVAFGARSLHGGSTARGVGPSVRVVFGRRFRCLLACWFALAVWLTIPALARAADTVIGFDDLSAGTQVTTQYSGLGVTFGIDTSGQSDRTGLVDNVGAAFAHSGTNVLNISSGGETSTSDVWAHFDQPRQHVIVYAGDSLSFGNNTADLTGAELDAYDFAGRLLASDGPKNVTADGRTDTEFSVAVATPEISYVRLYDYSSQQGYIVIDDMTFDTPSGPPPPPDFALHAPLTGVTLAAGRSAAAPFYLNRTSNSIGEIGLSVAGLPTGVTATASPNPTSGGDNSTVIVTFSAAADAPGVMNQTVTLTGTAIDPRAGDPSTPRVAYIPVTVYGPGLGGSPFPPGTVDLRAQGIDVTQGIQRGGLLVPSGAGSGGDYGGADLVAGKTTIVRVYADAHGAPAAGVPGVGVALRGYRNGAELRGSPLMPDYGPTSLTDTGESDPAPVYQPERTTGTNAFTFTLPYDWTDVGSLTLIADVYPPVGSLTGGTYGECPDPSCTSNDSFTLNNVTFQETRPFTFCSNVCSGAIRTVAISSKGASTPSNPYEVFKYADAVTPWSGIDIGPFEGTVDVSDALSMKDVAGDISDFFGDPDAGWYLGVGCLSPLGFSTGDSTIAPISYVDDPACDKRPLSGVAHGLFHLFGLPHASTECGGGADNDSDDQNPPQQGEAWRPIVPAPGEPTEIPPDDGIGQLDGIALDTTSSPYKLISSGFDFMSYCANIGGGDPNDWVSLRNWEAVFQQLAVNGTTAARIFRDPTADRSAAVGAGNHNRLRVIAFVDTSGVEITNVLPQSGAPVLAGSPSSAAFTLTARGGSGQVLASVPMTARVGHIDHVGPLDELTADVPARNVDQIQVIAADGQVVASRSRDPHPPRVHILAPRRGSRVGAGPTTLIRWRSRDPDSPKRKAMIDYSRDDGRTWQTIFLGPDRGRAVLPSFYLIASHAARVRVRINDGFNETAAVSSRFTALGAPPIVHIVTPASGGELAGDATLQLAGQALDQTLRQLSGNRMRWFDGPFLLGTGTQLSAGPLPPGANHIRLVAVDRAGRRSSAAVEVTVNQAYLPFLSLAMPKRISRRAQRLTLRAASSLPSVLEIGGKSYALTRSPREIKLSLHLGRTPLLFKLKITAAGHTIPFAAEVGRF